MTLAGPFHGHHISNCDHTKERSKTPPVTFSLQPFQNYSWDGQAQAEMLLEGTQNCL